MSRASLNTMGYVDQILEKEVLARRIFTDSNLNMPSTNPSMIQILPVCLLIEIDLPSLD